MGMYHKVRVGDITINSIDWEMNPDISFGTFESWGGRERVRNNNERVYYFFIDNWGAEPKLCLMERAVKHARIIAEIKAPNDLIRKCVEDQGRSSTYEKSYAINEQVKDWLIAHVLDETGDSRLIMPTVDVEAKEDMGPMLPRTAQTPYTGEVVRLPDAPAFIQEEELLGVLMQWNFFEAELHPEGRFANSFVDAGIPGVIIDQRTQLMWQIGGIDIGSTRHVQKGIEEANRNRWAGFADWRLPTMEEALSLLEPVQNSKGLFLHPAFSKEQPFIFVAAQRKPGGYWFVDFKQGRAFWSSGTIPGGFGRLVRSV
jgi:hypothetical protein